MDAMWPALFKPADPLLFLATISSTLFLPLLDADAVYWTLPTKFAETPGWLPLASLLH